MLNQGPRIKRASTATFILMVPMIASSACQTRELDKYGPGVREVSALEDIRVGANVSFEGKVTDVYANGAFRIEPALAAATREGILVIPDEAVPVAKNEVVRLVARLTRMTRKTIKQHHGLDPRAYRNDFEEENLLVASAHILKEPRSTSTPPSLSF